MSQRSVREVVQHCDDAPSRWCVYSRDGSKKLGGPYDTKEEANKRLGQIEFFKKQKGALEVLAANEGMTLEEILSTSDYEMLTDDTADKKLVPNEPAVTTDEGDYPEAGEPPEGAPGPRTCVCPKCGTKLEKEVKSQTPCRELKCPKCGAQMQPEAEKAETAETEAFRVRVREAERLVGPAQFITEFAKTYEIDPEVVADMGWDLPGRLHKYNVWGDVGRGKAEVVETSDDLNYLQNKYGPGLPVSQIGAARGVQPGGLGFGGGPKAAGPGGYCVCPECGHKIPHQTGQPCYSLKCPKCGADTQPLDREAEKAPAPLEEQVRVRTPDGIGILDSLGPAISTVYFPDRREFQQYPNTAIGVIGAELREGVVSYRGHCIEVTQVATGIWAWEVLDPPVGIDPEYTRGALFGDEGTARQSATHAIDNFDILMSARRPVTEHVHRCHGCGRTLRTQDGRAGGLNRPPTGWAWYVERGRFHHKYCDLCISRGNVRGVPFQPYKYYSKPYGRYREQYYAPAPAEAATEYWMARMTATEWLEFDTQAIGDWARDQVIADAWDEYTYSRPSVLERSEWEGIWAEFERDRADLFETAREQLYPPDHRQSKGHLKFAGNYEYFTGPDGNVYRASLTGVIDLTSGYRKGGRFFAIPSAAEEMLAMVGEIQEAAWQALDQKGNPITSVLADSEEKAKDEVRRQLSKNPSRRAFLKSREDGGEQVQIKAGRRHLHAQAGDETLRNIVGWMNANAQSYPRVGRLVDRAIAEYGAEAYIDTSDRMWLEEQAEMILLSMGIHPRGLGASRRFARHSREAGDAQGQGRWAGYAARRPVRATWHIHEKRGGYGGSEFAVWYEDAGYPHGRRMFRPGEEESAVAYIETLKGQGHIMASRDSTPADYRELLEQKGFWMFGESGRPVRESQLSFNPVDFTFRWTDDWYEWDHSTAHQQARRARDAKARDLRAQGHEVRSWAMANQRVSRGGIGSGKPHIDLVVTVYMIDYVDYGAKRARPSYASARPSPVAGGRASRRPARAASISLGHPLAEIIRGTTYAQSYVDPSHRADWLEWLQGRGVDPNATEMGMDWDSLYVEWGGQSAYHPQDWGRASRRPAREQAGQVSLSGLAEQERLSAEYVQDFIVWMENVKGEGTRQYRPISEWAKFLEEFDEYESQMRYAAFSKRSAREQLSPVGVRPMHLAEYLAQHADLSPDRDKAFRNWLWYTKMDSGNTERDLSEWTALSEEFASHIRFGAGQASQRPRLLVAQNAQRGQEVFVSLPGRRGYHEARVTGHLLPAREPKGRRPGYVVVEMASGGVKAVRPGLVFVRELAQSHTWNPQTASHRPARESLNWQSDDVDSWTAISPEGYLFDISKDPDGTWDVHVMAFGMRADSEFRLPSEAAAKGWAEQWTLPPFKAAVAPGVTEWDGIKVGDTVSYHDGLRSYRATVTGVGFLADQTPVYHIRYGRGKVARAYKHQIIRGVVRAPHGKARRSLSTAYPGPYGSEEYYFSNWPSGSRAEYEEWAQWLEGKGIDPNSQNMDPEWETLWEEFTGYEPLASTRRRGESTQPTVAIGDEVYLRGDVLYGLTGTVTEVGSGSALVHVPNVGERGFSIDDLMSLNESFEDTPRLPSRTCRTGDSPVSLKAVALAFAQTAPDEWKAGHNGRTYYVYQAMSPRGAWCVEVFENGAMVGEASGLTSFAGAKGWAESKAGGIVEAQKALPAPGRKRLKANDG